MELLLHGKGTNSEIVGKWESTCLGYLIFCPEKNPHRSASNVETVSYDSQV